VWDVFLVSLQVDFSLKGLVAARKEAREWLEVGVFALVSDAKRRRQNEVD
jgi:hypothetical protein